MCEEFQTTHFNSYKQIRIRLEISMTQNICDCHCGTRIDVDEQLLQQREMWKQKYLCLQKQFKVDIQMLKQNIYAECSGIMQQQFTQKELQHNKIVNQKNSQIKDLITRIINLETQVKVLTKEKQILEEKVKEIQSQSKQKDQALNHLRSKSSKSIRDWELKHEQELANLKQRLAYQSKDTLDKAETQKEILRAKLKEFENKYQKIIPEIEKMKCALSAKSSQNDELIGTIQKLKKKQEEDQLIWNSKYQDLKKIHSACSKQIKQLGQKNDELYREVDRTKKTTKQVKVEAVYIDRPVEVQKVVEKVVHVQKLVNKYVENPVYEKKIKDISEENLRLKDQLNNMLKQIKQIEEHYKKCMLEFEETIKQHERNVVLYKRERESLASKIGEQNKQLELLHNLIERLSLEKGSKNQNDQKIIVHVKKDGTYQKTVQKLPTQTNNQKKKK